MASTYDTHDKIIERIDDAMIDNSIIMELRKESSDLWNVMWSEQSKILRETYDAIK